MSFLGPHTVNVELLIMWTVVQPVSVFSELEFGYTYNIDFFIIFQMRLDFTSFVITGPNTVTTSVASALVSPKLGTGFAYTGSCLTDLFTVSDSHVPPLCGTLTGEHG